MDEITNEKGVKACPFCGPFQFWPSLMACEGEKIGDPWTVYHGACGTLGPIGRGEKALHYWNDAYCWKEISFLKARIAELEKTLKIISTTNGLQYSDIFKICDDALSPEAKI